VKQLKITLSFLLVVGLIGGLISTVSAADVKGRLKVLVRDVDKKPIEGVKITLTSMQTSAKTYTIVTNEKGKASIAGIDPDFYKVRAEKEGYQYLEGRVKLRPGIKVKETWTMLTEEQAKATAIAATITAMPEEQRKELAAKDLHNEGIKAYGNGDIKTAREKFKKAVEMDPNVSYIDYLLLGQFAFNEKNVDEALPYLEKARELDKDHADKEGNILTLLGACYMIKQNYPKVKDVWGELVQFQPKPDILYNLANLEIKDKNYDEAIRWLEMCRSKNPDFAEGLSLLGDLYIQQKNYDKGLEVYREYVALLEKTPGTKAEDLKKAKDTVKLLEEMKKK
jgi:tetratricopeptide (TPR) repeat protein